MPTAATSVAHLCAAETAAASMTCSSCISEVEVPISWNDTRTLSRAWKGFAPFLQSPNSLPQFLLENV